MRPLTIMTWNVRYFSHMWRGARSSTGNLRRAAQAIVASGLQPDVIALQEIEDTSLRGGLGDVRQLDRFRSALHHALYQTGCDDRYQGHYVPVHRYAVGAAALYTTGLAFLVREGLRVGALGSQEITHFRIPLFAPLKQRRAVSWLAVEGVTIFNTHLSLPAFFEGGPHTVPTRMGTASNQRCEVEHLLSAIGERSGVLVGDFNSQRDSLIYGQIQQAGWEDACPEVPGGATARFMRWRMHIDHIFVRGVSCDARRGFGIEEDSVFLGLSDHSPKWIRLTGSPGPA